MPGRGYTFAYNAAYLASQLPAISVTLPKREEPYESEYLFPFFSNMLPEGINRRVICRSMRIDEDDFFGSDNRPLLPTMQMAQTQAEGIINGIKNATTIRFLARLSGNLKEKDITAERERFARDNLAGNATGVAMFDSKYADVKQIESAAMVVNPKQQELIRASVFEYFGTNEKILTNTYNEDEWNAYYEGFIEPFAIQLSLVLTAMTFTPEEIAAGASIIATANRLQYASNQTKLNVVTQLFDRGFLTHNQGLEIFNMSPVEDGDKHYIRKEYTEVSNLDTVGDTSKEGDNGDHTGNP